MSVSVSPEKDVLQSSIKESIVFDGNNLSKAGSAVISVSNAVSSEPTKAVNQMVSVCEATGTKSQKNVVVDDEHDLESSPACEGASQQSPLFSSKYQVCSTSTAVTIGQGDAGGEECFGDTVTNLESEFDGNLNHRAKEELICPPSSQQAPPQSPPQSPDDQVCPVPTSITTKERTDGSEENAQNVAGNTASDLNGCSYGQLSLSEENPTTQQTIHSEGVVALEQFNNGTTSCLSASPSEETPDVCSLVNDGSSKGDATNSMFGAVDQAFKYTSRTISQNGKNDEKDWVDNALEQFIHKRVLKLGLGDSASSEFGDSCLVVELDELHLNRHLEVYKRWDSKFNSQEFCRQVSIRESYFLSSKSNGEHLRQSISPGLMNLECMCWILSTLQALFSIPPFVMGFYKMLKDLTENDDNGFIVKVGDLLDEYFWKKRTSELENSRISNMCIKSLIDITEYSVDQQETADDFFCKMDDQIEGDLFEMMFQMRIKKRRECMSKRCEWNEVYGETFEKSIMVNVPRKITNRNIQWAVLDEFKPRKHDGFNCKDCGKSVTTQDFMVKQPNIMKITIRKDPDERKRRPIRLNKEIDISDMSKGQKGEDKSISTVTKYLLVCVVYYEPNNESIEDDDLDTVIGHYTTSFMDWRTGLWFNADDDNVRKIDAPLGINEDTKIIDLCFYVKEDYFAAESLKKTIIESVVSAKLESMPNRNGMKRTLTTNEGVRSKDKVQKTSGDDMSIMNTDQGKTKH
jgi:hypothetical protein